MNRCSGVLCRATWMLTLVAGSLSAQAPAAALRSATDSARHLLDRFSWGPTSASIAEVVRLGPLPWFERQLTLAATPAPLPTRLHHSAREWWDLYQIQQQTQVARQQAPGMVRDPAMTNPLLPQLIEQYRALTLQRAVSHEAQVVEVLADFWGNHFNVFLRKGAVRGVLVPYVETSLRPHLLGSFEELLLATARSPAMLLYLDNAQSVAAPAARGARAGAMPNRGLNENYARELLELHTLGVDGGYSQEDVINVARILTGWGIDRATGAFRFAPGQHDRDRKQVLGVTFPAGGGEEEGVRLLRMLASHPATMHHVSRRLCARFVADQPTDGCIDDAVAAWQAHDGDLRAVLRAIVRSPDFWAAAAVQSKIRTPLGFVTAAIRAVGGVTDSTPRAARQVTLLGQPLFEHLAPDGYPETQDDWVNSGALLARMNFAVALAADRIPGIRVSLDAVAPRGLSPQALVARLDTLLLGTRMTDHTRDVILREMALRLLPQEARTLAVGLVLGSPEFQRR